MTMQQLFEYHDANDTLLVSEWPAGLAICPKWAPISVNVWDVLTDEDRYPWLNAEVDLISNGVIYYRGK